MRWRERLSVFNLLEFEFALLLNDDQHFLKFAYFVVESKGLLGGGAEIQESCRLIFDGVLNSLDFF